MLLKTNGSISLVFLAELSMKLGMSIKDLVLISEVNHEMVNITEMRVCEILCLFPQFSEVICPLHYSRDPLQKICWLSQRRHLLYDSL